jgi:hypothetical protein
LHGDLQVFVERHVAVELGHVERLLCGSTPAHGLVQACGFATLRLLGLGGVGGAGGDLGGGGEKVFFDDGQVRVTESLVTIGHPWNKAFAVREITSVTYGKNKSNDLGASILRTVGWLALGFGLLVGVAGFWPGMVFGLFMGLGLLFGSHKKDAPYSVTLSTGVIRKN